MFLFLFWGGKAKGRFGKLQVSFKAVLLSGISAVFGWMVLKRFTVISNSHIEFR